jgi:hypothetical protein
MNIASNIFLALTGREYDTWITYPVPLRVNGHEGGELIEIPSYIIESLFMDELGLTATDVNYPDFDKLGHYTTGLRHDWKHAISLYNTGHSAEVIKKIAFESGILSLRDYKNRERVVAIDQYIPTTQLNTSDVVVEGLPLVKVKQTPLRYIKNEFYLNYKFNYGSGNYDKGIFVNASDDDIGNTRTDSITKTYTALCTLSQSKYNVVNPWIYNADSIRDDATAKLFIKFMADWLAMRKWEIEATLWYSEKTLTLEVGDEVKWVLNLLPVSMQDKRVLGVTATPSTASGSLVAGTYYYRVTALDAYGETMASAQVSAILGATGHIDISWTALSGAYSYRVWGREDYTQNSYWSVPSGTTLADTRQAFDDSDQEIPIFPASFIITRIVDYGLKGGHKLKLNFQQIPQIFSYGKTGEGYGKHYGRRYGKGL